jgi:exopolysaccharide biosynthesis predicted pyruvyltransferase EpsI
MTERLDPPPQAPSRPQLHERLLARLDDHLDGARRVAILDFPDHGNVGDSAIWLGERQALEELGVEVVYVCSCDTYDRSALLRRLGREGVVLLHGGGNFGDLYPRHQAFREHVLDDLPGHAVVQLPQTVWVDRPERLERTRVAVERHGRFSMLVRDRASAELARTVVPGEVSLCPDPATALTLARTRAPAADVLWLLRADKEAPSTRRGRITDDERTMCADWPTDPLPARARVWATRQAGRLTSRLALPPVARSSDAETWDARARARVDRGIDLLSSARVVVTDRLHGHILSDLLDLPHVALDNTYGKIASYTGCWGIAPGRAHLADDLEQAERTARGLLAAGGR